MLRQIAALLGFALVTAAASPAEAARISYSITEEMEFIAPTEITGFGAGKDVALCRLYKETSVFGIPVWLSAQAYVLSTSECTGVSYFDDPQLISQALSDGRIAASVADQPAFTILERVQRHPASFGLALLVLLNIAWRLRGKRPSRLEQRLEVLGLQEGPVFRFIDVMLHAAKADGTTQPEEVAYIRQKATDLTQLEYSDEHIAWAIDRTEKLNSPRDFRIFGQGLTPDQSRVVLRAALAVVAADGTMTRAERKFISQLATGLSLDLDMIEKIMQPTDDMVPAE
ncbi:MAG: DUF533 domain-containing protein [Pseudomonadota bacterium]